MATISESKEIVAISDPFLMPWAGCDHQMVMN